MAPPPREATAGQRTAINLGGIEVGEVARGETLTRPGSLSVTRRVDAAIDLLHSAKAAQARRARAPAPRHGRSSGPCLDRRRGGRGCAGSASVRAAAARERRGADARRSLHHSRLLAAGHDWRRRGARPGADAARRALGRRARRAWWPSISIRRVPRPTRWRRWWRRRAWPACTRDALVSRAGVAPAGGGAHAGGAGGAGRGDGRGAGRGRAATSRAPAMRW